MWAIVENLCCVVEDVVRHRRVFHRVLHSRSKYPTITMEKDRYAVSSPGLHAVRLACRRGAAFGGDRNLVPRWLMGYLDQSENFRGGGS